MNKRALKRSARRRTRRFAYAIVAGAAIVVLAGCAVQARHQAQRQDDRAVSTDAGSEVFSSARYGIRLRYPAELELHRDFSGSYLANKAWKTYAGPDAAPGQPLASLAMPGSNEVTAGELRIGVSRDPAAIDSCTSIPAAALPESVGETMIDGVAFATFNARDAGMSHYLTVRGYRAVHAGACYAIDVLVYGTNPRVYDPPRTPPFTSEQIFSRLVPVAEALQFTVSAEER